MIYSSLKKRGILCAKDERPWRVISIKRSSTYQELVEAGKDEFWADAEDSGNFYLANSEGHRISDKIDGHVWTLSDYLERNGLYPSKLKVYVVKPVTFLKVVFTKS